MRKPKEPLPSAELNLEEDGGMSLPPRSMLHPSNKMKLIRSFYLSLIVLFVLLMVGLIIWGVQFMEAR